MKKKNTKPFTKLIYKRLHLGHENYKKLLMGTGMHLTFIHSSVHGYF